MSVVVRHSGNPTRQSRRRWVSIPFELVSLVLVLTYILLIFIVPPLADAYADAGHRRQSDPVVLERKPVRDPGPEYRSQVLKP